ncbi:hypothetical protein NEIMUCOT_04795 [Neisseria mucosa ATCC 25996]|uniref:Uncharacterized protein n=1 Tax=Neisseria mucosa (strain ATCC 25996 / DSM 4631 / NCTC 10774 / M26) TaxID=546266 RepID=D2ZW02_NEIM2|nr:hypothetical protein NEIMUCOT_04795 [Neisseria mucosa ATCC 25996]
MPLPPNYAAMRLNESHSSQNKKPTDSNLIYYPPSDKMNRDIIASYFLIKII